MCPRRGCITTLKSLIGLGLLVLHNKSHENRGTHDQSSRGDHLLNAIDKAKEGVAALMAVFC